MNESSVLASSLDRVSLRSRSPEDSSSLLSASAGSLDSALNHSRDEDEIRAIMGPNDESFSDSMDLSLMATIQGNCRRRRARVVFKDGWWRRECFTEKARFDKK